MDLLQLSPPEPNPSRNAEKTVFVTLSIISAIAAVIGALKGSPLALQIGFFACTAIALLAAFIFPPLHSRWYTWQNSRKDMIEIRVAMPKLRILADDFSQFVSGSSSETLHYIALNVLCKADHIAQEKLRLPPMELWTCLITNFKTRLQSEPKDADDFIALFMEFHFMVGISEYLIHIAYRGYSSCFRKNCETRPQKTPGVT